MHTDVAEALRSICQATLDALGARTAIPYADDLAFESETQYLLVPIDVLTTRRPKPRPGRRRADASEQMPEVELDASAREVLDNASSLDDLDASRLASMSFAFYAVVVGDNPDQRVSFVERWNPYRAGLSGHLTTFFGDKLRRVAGPLLVFQQSFDMVVTKSAMAVLNATGFEVVFRDIDSMTARFSVWSQAAVTALPLDGDTAQRLCALCDRGGRVAKQLRGMYERGAFGSKFTIPALRAEMQKQKLDDSRLLQNDQLALQDDDIPIMLKLIDEKLYTGWSTNKRWDVGTRSER
ncbi:MAG: hypothetical protein M0T72_11605 [Candidatus Dormibacteraeota bacterium]|nr:hypothetical protein [Candidatus Dormibacteraeota bacterium]